MVNLANYSTEIQEAKQSTGGASQVPSGDYIVVCVNTEEKQNSKKTGHYIQNDYEIQEGEYAGEKLVDRINHDNPNEVARSIAFATLKSLGNAINMHPLPSTDKLIGKRIIATVKNVASDRPIEDDNGIQRTDSDGKPMFYRNINITKYKAYSAGETTQVETSGSFPFPK
jgi:hypothetical protein